MDPVTVNRQELLQQLDAVSPGLATREIIEQSSCFVFTDGEIITYNDEVSCRQKTSIKLSGVVQSKPLISILQKLSEDSVQLEVGEGELVIIGKRRKAGIRMDKDLLLPIKNVEKPKKWKPVSEGFADAINLVHECAGKDESQFWSTCVHINDKWIEACDNFQLSRYKLQTGISSSILVKSHAIKHLVALDAKELCETETWIHFRNSHGLVFSCRRYIEQYPDLTKMLKVSGTPTTLPKGLSDAAEKAEVFSAENTDNNQVLVEIRPGRLRIKGVGVSGWFAETKKLKYKGESLSFMVSPKLLSELVKRYSECEITADRLKVNGGSYTYLACLEKSKENGDAATASNTEEG